MADTTLGNATLNGTDTLGGTSSISENSCRKEAMLTPMPLYLQDSDNTDVFDYGGVIKTITLSGKYVDDRGTSYLRQWIEKVEGFIQGHQDNLSNYPLTFTDDLRGYSATGYLKVKVMDFESVFNEGSPSIITWTLKIVESSLNS
jgi:hypothetical protein